MKSIEQWVEKWVEKGTSVHSPSFKPPAPASIPAIHSLKSAESDEEAEETEETQELKDQISWEALWDRNVMVHPDPGDPATTFIEGCLTREVFQVTKEDQRRWKIDLLKCQKSNVATFRRTIMMNLISRHDLETSLDYACEQPWDCPSAPRRNPLALDQLPAIQPDLVVGFKTTTFFDSLETG